MSSKKTRYSVTFPEPFIEGIKRLVREGIYLDNGAVIRDAVRLLLEVRGIPPFYPEAGAE